jgi:hypothetical protein
MYPSTVLVQYNVICSRVAFKRLPELQGVLMKQLRAWQVSGVLEQTDAWQCDGIEWR